MKSRIKKVLVLLKSKFSNNYSEEEIYYRKLFIDNPVWNKPNPNNEEILRWNIIKGFLIYIKKNFQNENIEILDLGSGRGWLTSLLAEYGNVTGVEPIRSVVKYAKQMFPKINFICGTTTDLLKKDHKKYDLVVTSEVIEHIADDNKYTFIKEINKLLKDNGFLIVTTPRKEVQKEWILYSNPNQPIEDWLLEAELEELILQNFFIKVKLERFSIQPALSAPEIEIYQLWLFKKTRNV